MLNESVSHVGRSTEPSQSGEVFIPRNADNSVKPVGKISLEKKHNNRFGDVSLHILPNPTPATQFTIPKQKDERKRRGPGKRKEEPFIGKETKTVYKKGTVGSPI